MWPHGGTPSDLVETRLSLYPDGTKKSVVFGIYKDVFAKDHERVRQASEVTIDYDIYHQSFTK